DRGWGVARLIYGMAADGDLPPALAATSNRGSPTRAAILVGSLAAVAAATGAVGALASTTVTALLAVLLVVNVAAIRTRHETGGWRPAPWMAWVGAATTGGLLLFQLFNLDQAGAIRLLALVGLGALGRLARPRGRSGGPRPDAAERATTNRHKPSTTTVIEPTARLSCGGGLPG
ncbi:MAG: amino acid permease, partial [Actinomycetota bacterium]